MNKGHLDAKSRKILSAEEKLNLAKQRGVYSEYDDAIKTLKKKNRQARFTASCRSVFIGFVINIQSFLVKVKKIVTDNL